MVRQNIFVDSFGRSTWWLDDIRRYKIIIEWFLDHGYLATWTLLLPERSLYIDLAVLKGIVALSTSEHGFELFNLGLGSGDFLALAPITS